MIARLRHIAASLLLASLGLGAAFAQSGDAEAERDRGLLQAFIEDNLSSAGRSVQIDGFAGALSSRATLERLSIADDAGTWLVMENAVLDWNRSAVLRGRIEINTLSAERLIIERLPETEAAEPELPSPEAPGFAFALLDLPVSIDIGTLAIGRAELGAPLVGEAMAITLDGRATLADGAGDAALTATRLDGPEGEIGLAGSFANATEALTLDLRFVEGAGGIAAGLLGIPGSPALDLAVEGTGTLDDFAATLRLASDGAPRLTGTFTLAGTDTGGRGFTAALAGDMRPLIEAEYHRFLGPRAALDLRGTSFADGRFEIADLALETQALTLAGALDLAPDGWPARFTLDGQIADSSGAPLLLPLSGEPTRIRSAEITLGYDAETGDAWQLNAVVSEFARGDIGLDRAALSGSGTLQRAAERVDGGLTVDLAGIALGDAALEAAVGEAVSGALRFDYAAGTALSLSALRLNGAGTTLSGNAVIVGFELGGSPRIDADLRVNTPDLARFSAIAGRDLAGAANLSVAGNVEPLGGAFDLRIAGETTDLVLSVPYLDPLIAGAATLDTAIRRDTTGTVLDRFAIESAEIALTASADLATGASTGEFAFALRDASAVEPRLSGPAAAEGAFTQTGDIWGVSAGISAPGGLRARLDSSVTVTEAGVGSVTGLADIAITALAPYSGLAGRPLSGAANVSLAGQGNLSDQRFEGTLTGTAQDLSVGLAPLDAFLAGAITLNVDAGLVGSDGLVTIRDGLFATDQGRLNISGSTAPGDGIDFDAALRDVALYLPDLQGPVTLVGRLEPSDTALALNAALTAPGGTEAQVAVDVPLSQGAIAGPIAADARFSIAALTPYAALVPQALSGAVEGTASGTYTLESGAAELVLAVTTRDLGLGIAPVDGLLRGTTALNAGLGFDGVDALRIDRLTVSNSQLEARIAGALSPRDADLRYQARLADLAALALGVSGGASVDGTVTLQDGDLALATALTAPGDTSGRIAAQARVVDAALAGVIDATADLSIGALSPYSAALGRALRGAADLKLSGSYEVVSGAAEASLDVTGQDLAFGLGSVDPLLRGSSRLQGSAGFNGTDRITLDAITFESPQMTAQVSGDASQTRGGALEYSARISNLGLLVADVAGPATAEGSLSSQDGQVWAVSSTVAGPGGIAARVSGDVAADASRVDIALTGTAPLSAANTAIAPNLLRGLVNFDLAVNGEPSLAAVSGTVRTSGASAAIPSVPLRLDNVEALIQLGNGRADLSVSGAVASGGRVEITGPVTLSPPFQGDLNITLRDIGVQDPNLYQTTASGQVAVNGPLTGGARISGLITLGPVEVRLPSSFGPSAVGLPGLIHEHEPNPVLRTRIRAGLNQPPSRGGGGGGGRAFPLDLTIEAPNQIFIRGRGLDAEMGGTLRLTGTTNNVITAGGFELIRGRLDILGERLTLTEGRVQLQGDFNPFVRLVATTTSGDVAIRIVIEGVGTDLDLEITSQPELPEEEVLAQLIFKRGLTEISAVQAVQLAVAVRTLAGGGGGGVVDRLRSSFGLDDLDITTNDEGEATLQVGRYLSDNVYTGVEVDSSGESAVTLNLQITPSVTARGTVTSDGETGLGIFFERDY
ncbi:MAG: translocation/assembly module TamB domain-containing protein [Pseudomonadota bacterium]